MTTPTLLIHHPQANAIRDQIVPEDFPVDIRLATNRSEAIAAFPAAEIIFALDPEMTSELIARAQRLRWFQALTSGLELVLAMPELRPGVILTSMRGAHGPQVSELVFLHMLALARRFPAMLENQRQHIWDHWPQSPLATKTVAIVGVGAIGTALAQRCRAFEMTVIGVDDHPADASVLDRLYASSALHDALGAADFVVLLVPYVTGTHHLIDPAALAAMRPDAFLINVARGRVVDEHALIAALQHGTIAGAGLDVFDEEPLGAASPLWTLPNVIVTPHVGGNSTTYIRQMRDTLRTNLRAYLDERFDDMCNRVERVL